MQYAKKIVVIFVLTVGWGTFGANVVPKNCVEEQVLDIVTTWQTGGVSSILPSLDVIKIKSVEGLYDGYGIKITYTTGDMQLRGVNNFAIDKLSVSAKDLKASTSLHFPLLSLTSDQYSLKGRAYMMYSLKGSGFMNATFQNVKLTIGTSLVTKGRNVQVGDINLDFSVGSIEVDLADSSWPINKVLNTSAMKIVESYRSDIITSAKDTLNQVFNEYLATTTSSQVLDLVGKDYCNYALLP